MHSGVPDIVPLDGIAATFANNGITGSIIGALLALVVYVLSNIKTIISASDARFDKQSNLHAEERKEVTVVVRDLTTVISKLSSQFEGRLK